MIVFRCSRCGKKVRVKEDVAGRKVKCPHCGELALVPACATEDEGDERIQESRALPSKGKVARQADHDHNDDDGDRPPPKRHKKSRDDGAAERPSSVKWVLGITLVVVGLGAAVLGGIWWLNTRALLAENEKLLDKMRGQVEKAELAAEKRGKFAQAELDKVKTHLDAETKKQEANYQNVKLAVGFGGGGLGALLLGLLLMTIQYGRSKGGKKRKRDTNDDE
jgi:DNA-directed RNA polymerase subunit RPC12/RpoP